MSATSALPASPNLAAVVPATDPTPIRGKRKTDLTDSPCSTARRTEEDSASSPAQKKSRAEVENVAARAIASIAAESKPAIAEAAFAATPIKESAKPFVLRAPLPRSCSWANHSESAASAARLDMLMATASAQRALAPTSSASLTTHRAPSGPMGGVALAAMLGSSSAFADRVPTKYFLSPIPAPLMPPSDRGSAAAAAAALAADCLPSQGSSSDSDERVFPIAPPTAARTSLTPPVVADTQTPPSGPMRSALVTAPSLQDLPAAPPTSPVNAGALAAPVTPPSASAPKGVLVTPLKLPPPAQANTTPHAPSSPFSPPKPPTRVKEAFSASFSFRGAAAGALGSSSSCPDDDDLDAFALPTDSTPLSSPFATPTSSRLVTHFGASPMASPSAASAAEKAKLIAPESFGFVATPTKRRSLAPPPSPLRPHQRQTFAASARSFILSDGLAFRIEPVENQGAAAATAASEPSLKEFRVTDSKKLFNERENNRLVIYYPVTPKERALILEKYTAFKTQTPGARELLNAATLGVNNYLAVSVEGTPLPLKEWLTNPFKTAHANAANGFISYQGKRLNVAPLMEAANQGPSAAAAAALPEMVCVEGTFAKIYTVTDNAKLLDGRENAQVLVKVFKTDFCEDGARYMENILQQYQLLKRAGFPVADILNLQTALKDGFVVVELVPTAFYPQDHWMDKKLAQISPTALAHLTTLRAFFDFGIKNGILLDLKPNNFKAASSGKLTLFDYNEINTANLGTIVAQYAQALKYWCCGNEEVKAFLLANIKNMDRNPLAKELTDPWI